MSYPFVQARWFRRGGNTPINRIVIHDMEYPERLTAAEDVARYFQRVDKKTSAHYCVDNNSVVQCVKDRDGAYHAPPNQFSIGIEHAGYARQTKAEWLDEYGVAMLRDQSAPLVKLLMREHNIPHVWLSVQDLRNGKRGITSHNNVSLAFGQSSHTDPGPNFPVAEFMAWCQPDSGPVTPTPPTHDPYGGNMRFLLTPDGTGIITFIYDDVTKTIKELTGKIVATPKEFLHLVDRGWLKPYNPANDQEKMDQPTFDFLIRK